MEPDTPVHLDVPFTITKAGAKTVEQGSGADIAASTLNVCVCTEGFREDSPLYGIPELPFHNVPLDLALLEEAVRRWEPEASGEAVEQAMGRIRERLVTVGA